MFTHSDVECNENETWKNMQNRGFHNTQSLMNDWLPGSLLLCPTACPGDKMIGWLVDCYYALLLVQEIK